MATYLQSDRPFQVETPLGPDKLLLLGFEGTEGISRCYRLVLDLASEDASIVAADLLRKAVTVTLELPSGEERHIRGVVSRFTQLHQDRRFAYYRAEVVPAFWFLSLYHDCRIFQNKTALEIVEQILGDRSIDFRKLGMTTTPATREYCVQYRETDLDFVSRLLEEEGILYTFDHTGSKETLVLADAGTTLPDAGSFRAAPAPLSTEDVVLSVTVEHNVHTSKVTLTDYDMENPATSLLRSSDSTTAGKGEEFYDYPGGYLRSDAGVAQARRTMEAVEVEEETVRGTSTCRAFQSGTRFALQEHYRADLNRGYLMVSVTHRAEGAGFLAGETPSFQYSNEFVAIPASRKFTPPRTTARPLVRGSQTAVVVGPAGEEIYVDKYGRVKVQFFWDRLGTLNEDSSCWMRVATSWAGQNWGTIHIPRIGQEVVVDFLEGDPDRPLVTGSVYNGEQMPPYTLPDNKTQSGIKSRSSLSGESANFNEIRFEDKKDSEELHVQAEKDLTLLVKNDETREVQHDRTTTIKNNDTRTVSEGNDVHTVKKGNQTITVEEGAQTIEVKQGHQDVIVGQGNQTLDIKQGDQVVKVGQGKQTLDVKVGDQETLVGQGNQTIDVKMGNQTTKLGMGNQSIELTMGNRTVKLDLGSITEEAMQGIELKVGQSSVKIDQTGVTVKGMMVKVEGQIQTDIKGLMTQVGGSGMLKLQGGITMIN